MKIQTFRKGDRVRIDKGTDAGAHGEVVDTDGRWVDGQGQFVSVRLDGRKHPDRYAGVSLRKEDVAGFG